MILETTQMKDKMYVKPKDIYKAMYKYKAPHRKHVTESEYHNIITTWAELALDELIEKGQTDLPGKLGVLKIKKIKSKKQPIDWAKFRRTGEVLPMKNSHSDGYMIKCLWQNRLNMYQRRLFSFKLTRIAAAKLSSYVKNNSFAIHNYDTIIN